MSHGHFMMEISPTLEDMQFLEDRLYDYNVEQTGLDDGQEYAFFVRDDDQEIRAGVAGWMWGGSCYVRSLWVHKALRGQSLGTKLLQSVEHEALARGCQQIVLASFSFQAPEFYHKLGFETFAVLEDHPRGYQHHYLRKRL
jgi:N-acetylglutamate synthase-like GNAT family acetyltransferase